MEVASNENQEIGLEGESPNKKEKYADFVEPTLNFQSQQSQKGVAMVRNRGDMLKN